MASAVLDSSDRNKVVAFVSTLDAFTGDARDRRDFVRAAGLGKFVGGINWAGPPNAVAGNLVDVLNSHGFLVENPNYHALARLLIYCLDYPLVGAEDANYLATLIVMHGLVRDPTYLENLRRTFNIAQTPPPEVQAPDVSAPLLPAVARPSFTVKPTLKDRKGLEQALSAQDNFLDIYLLVGALYCSQAVGRVEAPEGQPQGTGWLIAPDMLLTNCHVLPEPEYAAEGVARFGYMRDEAGVKIAEERVIKLDVDFYYTSPEDKLDYALVRLKEKPLAAKMLPAGVGDLSMLDLLRQDKHRGYLVAAARDILNLQPVNVIQHPSGDPLKVVMTQNLVADDATAMRVHYYADTKRGSSGSPVFNRLWEVIALHHSGGPYPPESATSATGEEVRYAFNEGIPVKAILAEFKTRKTDKGFPLMAFVPEAK
ncbi:MAG: trypsin-like peptidase domain-containing protein [Verrucomicrobiia bacterium]